VKLSQTSLVGLRKALLCEVSLKISVFLVAVILYLRDILAIHVPFGVSTIVAETDFVPFVGFRRVDRAKYVKFKSAVLLADYR
jgi:hypothetical protein